MSITAADILAMVNSRLSRSETSIDTELVDALQDLSVRGDFIESTVAVYPVDGDEAVAAPSRIRSIESIECVDSDGNFCDPLEPITMAELTRKVGYDSTEGTPLYYARFGSNLFLYPICDDSYVLTVYYYSYHAASTTVEFDDRFREAIACKVTAEVARGLEMYVDADKWMAQYAIEVAKLQGDNEQPDAAAVCVYTDI